MAERAFRAWDKKPKRRGWRGFLAGFGLASLLFVLGIVAAGGWLSRRTEFLPCECKRWGSERACCRTCRCCAEVGE
jgi:hypothetical protein